MDKIHKREKRRALQISRFPGIRSEREEFWDIICPLWCGMKVKINILCYKKGNREKSSDE